MPAAGVGRRGRADEESDGRAAVPNPYTGEGPPSAGDLIFDKGKRLGYMAISSYFLFKRMNFYEIVKHSPHVKHEWFKIGLGATIAILSIKAYVELFEGLVRKKKVNYENFRQATHAALILILVSSVAFHVALWPHYGWNTPVALMLCFFGIIVQFLVVVPPWISNAVAFVGLTFFLQEYK